MEVMDKSMRKCPTCGISFKPSKKNPPQIYCSKACWAKRGSLFDTSPKFSGIEKVFFEAVVNKVSRIYHCGMPDFLIEHNKKLIFVEIKSKTDEFRKKQSLVMKLLSSHNIDCFYFIEGIGLLPFNAVDSLIDFKRKKVAPLYNILKEIESTDILK